MLHQLFRPLLGNVVIRQEGSPIPPSLHERIFASDVVSIETWIDRVLEARELLSVFEGSVAGISALGLHQFQRERDRVCGA